MHADPSSDPGGIRTRDLHGESVATTTTSPLGLSSVARVRVELTNSRRFELRRFSGLRTVLLSVPDGI